MVDTVVLMGGQRNETEREMRKVLLFEQQIANVSFLYVKVSYLTAAYTN